MSHLLLPIAVVGYIVSILFAGIATIYHNVSARKTASVLFVVTWVTHLGAVVRQAVIGGRLPLTNVAEYLLVLGWIVLTLHLFVWFRLRVQVSGLVLAPLAAIAALASQQLMAVGPLDADPRLGGWFLFHTTVSTLGMSILCVAFAMSLIYLIQDRAIKSRKTLGLLQRLPALERCDRIGFRSLVLGFVLLSVGIGTGVVINEELYARLWINGPKQIFPVLAWIVFAGILAARTALGFRGRKAAYLTIAGFVLGVATVAGMTL